MSNNHFWGFHTLIDAADCLRSAVTNPDTIAAFCKELVVAIDMVAYGEPQLVHFGEDNKAGWTAIQLISTSNFMMHACDSTGDIYFDCFSCKPYDVTTVEQVFRKYFAPQRIRINYITRQA